MAQNFPRSLIQEWTEKHFYHCEKLDASLRASKTPVKRIGMPEEIWWTGFQANYKEYFGYWLFNGIRTLHIQNQSMSLGDWALFT